MGCCQAVKSSHLSPFCGLFDGVMVRDPPREELLPVSGKLIIELSWCSATWPSSLHVFLSLSRMLLNLGLLTQGVGASHTMQHRANSCALGPGLTRFHWLI